MYQALYRKWRPRTFDDVVGQEAITTTLKNEVATGKLSHAYLFCGSRGTGKTTCSKILAKAVNCRNPVEGNPCGECDICTGIDSDSILDVTEIDAASNSGVDNIRELREEANFTPVTGKYRVYIIDETHMLSTGAFNALLKIMEEPPPHVLFILATTELHKVPATILSRCQRFDFRRIPSEIIAERLLLIAEEEGAALTKDAAMLIARLSDGGMRDAISLLDLCLSAGEEITADAVREAAGLAAQDYLFDMAEAVIEEDGAKALEILGSLWEYSVDYQRFCEQLLDFYRDLLVVKTARDATELVEGTPRELELLGEIAAKYSPGRIFYSLTVLSDTLGRMARTAARRTEMEMGLLKLCNPAMDTSPEALLARIEQLEQNPVPARVEISAKPEPAGSVEKADEIKPALPENARPTEDSSTADEVSKIEAVPFEPWPKLLDVLKKKNKALYGTLVNSSAYLSGKRLLVDAGSELFAQMLRNDEYAKESLREAAFSVTGQRYNLGPYQPDRYRVKEEPAKLDDLLQSGAELGVEMDINE